MVSTGTMSDCPPAGDPALSSPCDWLARSFSAPAPVSNVPATAQTLANAAAPAPEAQAAMPGAGPAAGGKAGGGAPAMPAAKPLSAYKPFWAKRFGTAKFLPTTRAEMDALGWDSCDVI